MSKKKYSIPEEESMKVSDPAIVSHAEPFTLAQREILNAIAGLSDEDVRDLQKAIALYFAHKADESMDELWANGTWNEQTLETLKHTHYRTPYNN
ncbi:MAG: hypothetical protein IKX44_12335 [Prevotella sp.]|nr:hypothetical protein [Prevotella sp.]